MNKKTLLLLASIIIIIAGGFGIYLYLQKDSPEMTFIEIKRAIENRDLEKFNECVDTDQVINSVIDQYIAYSTKANNGELDIATGLIAFMRPSIIEMVKEQVRYSISEGKIEIPKDVSISSEVLGLLTLANGDGANFKGIKEKKVTESQAEITFLLQLDGSDVTNEVLVKFRKTENGWQIYDVLNLASLVESYVETQK